MTFGSIIELVRREIIVDNYEDAFEDQDLRTVLWRASVETAAAFDIPHRMLTITIAAGATSIPISPTPRKVHTVVFNGDDMRSADVQELLRIAPGAGRPPRYFNFDPRRQEALMISPAPAVAGTARVEVSPALIRPADNVFDDREPWDGVLPEFHALIAYRAAVTLYQMDERQEESAYWVNEYQNRSSELAAFLGRTDIPNLIIPAEQRDDRGVRE